MYGITMAQFNEMYRIYQPTPGNYVIQRKGWVDDSLALTKEEAERHLEREQKRLGVLDDD